MLVQFNTLVRGQISTFDADEYRSRLAAMLARMEPPTVPAIRRRSRHLSSGMGVASSVATHPAQQPHPSRLLQASPLIEMTDVIVSVAPAAVTGTIDVRATIATGGSTHALSVVTFLSTFSPAELAAPENLGAAVESVSLLAAAPSLEEPPPLIATALAPVSPPAETLVEAGSSALSVSSAAGHGTAPPPSASPSTISAGQSTLLAVGGIVLIGVLLCVICAWRQAAPDRTKRHTAVARAPTAATPTQLQAVVIPPLTEEQAAGSVLPSMPLPMASGGLRASTMEWLAERELEVMISGQERVTGTQAAHTSQQQSPSADTSDA